MGLLKTAALAAAICIVGTAAVADSQAVRPMFRVFPTTGHIAVPGRPTVSPLPSFTYTVHDPVGHKQYTGMILDRTRRA